MKILDLLMVSCAGMLIVAHGARGQSTRSLIREGNGLFRDQKYTDAEVSYRKALEKEKSLVQGHFNLGDALHKQGKFDEAMKEYETALGEAQEKDTKAYAYYNIGNSQLRQQSYQDAIKSYIETLKINPEDEDAKYNLSYALEKLRQQQNQKQDKNKNKDNKQDKKDQDKKNQQEKQDQPQQKKQQQQQQKQMSKSEAERILNVLKNSEKDVQRKMRVRQAVRPKTDKDW